jgi:outer membrane protein OmpA-like peptidoglycan-associated protein/polyisoprenoid-binding protein YceI
MMRLFERKFFWALPALFAVLAGSALVLGGQAYAQAPFAAGWSLQPAESKLNFQTIKSQTIVELSSFASLHGDISPDGVASVTISLDSVDTGIDLRNVRLRFLLFETFKFPEAVVTMRLNPADLRDLPSQHRVTLKAAKYDLSLHGVTRPMVSDIVVTMLSDTMVSVSSAAPISVAAADFGLSDGVKKLEDANQVPIIPSGSVTFDFTFKKNANGETQKVNTATVPPQQTAVEKAGELDTEACAGRFEIISRTGAIYFRTGSAELDGESRPLLDSVVQIVSRCPKLVIQVAGHTDSTGDPTANRVLSQSRANAVVQYLTGHGIATNRLEAVGFGDTRPVVPNDSAANRSRNRRIVFSVVGGG